MDFTTTDLTNMQTCQEAHMMDSCKIYAVSVTVDTYGQNVESWPTAGSEIDCGLDMRPGTENRGPEYTKLEYDATLRLALGTSIDKKDKIHITKRFGVALSADLVFEVVSPIQQGPSGIRVLLRRTET